MHKVFIAVLLITALTWKQTTCVSPVEWTFLCVYNPTIENYINTIKKNLLHATKCDSLRHNVELKSTGTKLCFCFSFFYSIYLKFKKRQNSPGWGGSD